MDLFEDFGVDLIIIEGVTVAAGQNVLVNVGHVMTMLRIQTVG